MTLYAMTSNGQLRQHRYRRTDLQPDKQTCISACTAAGDRAMKSRAERIESELGQVSDLRATWRTAQKVVYDNDAECVDLTST